MYWVGCCLVHRGELVFSYCLTTLLFTQRLVSLRHSYCICFGRKWASLPCLPFALASASIALVLLALSIRIKLVLIIYQIKLPHLDGGCQACWELRSSDRGLRWRRGALSIFWISATLDTWCVVFIKITDHVSARVGLLALSLVIIVFETNRGNYE